MHGKTFFLHLKLFLKKVAADLFYVFFFVKTEPIRHIFPGTAYHLEISYLIHSGLFVFVL